MSTAFKCPHCGKTGNYFRLITTTTKEHRTPFHKIAFITQEKSHVGQRWRCCNCKNTVTEHIKILTEELKP